LGGEPYCARISKDDDVDGDMVLLLFFGALSLGLLAVALAARAWLTGVGSLLRDAGRFCRLFRDAPASWDTSIGETEPEDVDWDLVGSCKIILRG
jgi:hypothetical protein